MTLLSLPTQNSPDIVEAALADLLQSPEIGPGSKLPTERALALRLDVPRSAVRAALARFEAQGAVVRIMGSGTYVAEKHKTVQASGSNAQDASPREIMETRILIEPRLAQMIVSHANGADMDQIRFTMESAKLATDFAEFEIWDAKFHQALADATKNRLMIEVYRTITTSRDLAEWGEMKRKSITEKRRRQYNQEHADIVQALMRRDAAAAEAAIHAHLVTVGENLLGGSSLG
jgi:DNA-binding FadR family transcriptional regulator